MTNNEVLAAADFILDHLKGDRLREVYLAIDCMIVDIAMTRSEGNCARAAKLLGMNRSTLVEKRRLHGFPMAPQPRNLKKRGRYDS